MSRDNIRLQRHGRLSMAGGDLVPKVGVGVAVADRHPRYFGLLGRHLADSGEVPETRHNAPPPQPCVRSEPVIHSNLPAQVSLQHGGVLAFMILASLCECETVSL
jgi:hypothetical protein